MLVSIIVVAWNSKSLIQAAIDNLAKSLNQDQFDGLEVIIVDNASTIEPIDGILLPQGLKGTVIKNSENKGFGFACNQGAALSKAKFLLFLNPDTLPTMQNILKGIGILEGDSQMGVFGPQLFNDNGIQRTCGNELSLKTLFFDVSGISKLSIPNCEGIHSTWDHQSSKAVSHLIGAFYLIKSKVFFEVGGFDERFFLYYEDYDLSKKVRSAGYTLWYDSDAKVFHLGGGTSSRIPFKRIEYSLHSKFLLIDKYFGVVWLGFYMVLSFFELILRSSLYIGRLQVPNCLKIWKLYFRVYSKVVFQR